MSGRAQVSAQNFFRRVKHFYSHWKDPKKEFKDAEAILFENGKNEETSVKIKTTAIYLWLFGQELTDSLVFFTKKTVVIVVSPTFAPLLEPLNTIPENFDIELLVLTKDDTKNASIFDKIQSLIQDECSGPTYKIGKLLKDKQQGPFAQETEQFFSTLSTDFIEIGALIQEALAIKEAEELEIIKKAGCVAVWFQNKVIGEVENIIDNEKKMRHSDISKEITRLLENDTEMKQLETTQKVERRFVDLAYDPIIQSGGVYDLKAQAESSNEFLSYDTIICSVGSKYHNFNCNIVRTLFIDPDNDQKLNYQIAFEAQNNVINKLKPGTSLKSIYESTVELIKAKRESLLACIPVSFGYGIGLEFRENNLTISGKNDRLVEAGMTFNITVTLNRLKAKNGADYAIMISDTVIVKSTGFEIITGKIPRKYEEISYSLKGEEEQKEPSRNAPKNSNPAKARGRNLPQKSETDEAKRKEHQKQLQEQKLNELKERIASGGIVGDKAKQKIDAERISAYRSINDLPKDMKKNQIYVDMKNDTVIVPIFGQMVPFHINVVKNVSKQEDEKKICSLRLNFHVPSAQSGSNVIFPEMKDQNVSFIRELTFRSKNSKNMADVVKKIKDLQKKIKDKQNEEKHVIWDPDSEPLVLIKGKKPYLQELKVRPNLSGKKSTGNLEAHANGFRFITKKGEKLDLTFSNIKHAFFQPCDNELIILLHFHLHKPILIGKKRTYDVQFYTEAGLQAEDLDNRRRGNDDDEYEAEEKERAQRKKLNEEFEAFTKAVEEAAKNQIDFDIPYRELGFQGAPSKASVNLYPTVHSLVNLTEAPFFIMTLEEVELAHFERIQYGLKNFDLTFVYKDYSKPVTRICAIPIQYLDGIKNWLDKMDIVFSESTVNLDWSKVIAEVREQIKNNAEEFLEEGGWGFLLPGSSDDEEGEDEEEDGDSAFEAEDDDVSDDEEESDEDEDEDDEGSDFDDDDASDEEDLDELEDEEDEEDEEDSRDAKRRKNIKNPMPAKKIKK